LKIECSLHGRPQDFTYLSDILAARIEEIASKPNTEARRREIEYAADIYWRVKFLADEGAAKEAGNL
jgi:hypothetical protein